MFPLLHSPAPLDLLHAGISLFLFALHQLPSEGWQLKTISQWGVPYAHTCLWTATKDRRYCIQGGLLRHSGAYSLFRALLHQRFSVGRRPPSVSRWKVAYTLARFLGVTKIWGSWGPEGFLCHPMLLLLFSELHSLPTGQQPPRLSLAEAAHAHACFLRVMKVQGPWGQEGIQARRIRSY